MPGEIYQLNLGGNKLIFIQSHALFDEICDESRFHKTVVSGLEKLRAGVNDGLFTAHDGEHNWGIAHRIIMPVFGPIKIRETLGGMKEVSQELCLKWCVRFTLLLKSCLTNFKGTIWTRQPHRYRRRSYATYLGYYRFMWHGISI